MLDLQKTSKNNFHADHFTRCPEALSFELFTSSEEVYIFYVWLKGALSVTDLPGSHPIAHLPEAHPHAHLVIIMPLRAV